MKLIAIAIAAVLVQAAPPQESDAEKLFKKMEDRLLAAKSIQFAVKLTTDRDPLDTTEATFVLGEGNRFRIDYKMHKGRPEDTYLIVSDGKEFKQTRLTDSWGPWKVAADSGEVIRIGVSRAGSGFFLMYYRLASKAEADKTLPVSNFKSGGKEKVAGIEAEIVEYAIEIPDRGKMQARLWIDPQRLVPLQRTLAGEFRGKKVTSTSTYESFKFDEPVDPATFKLP